MATYSKSHDTQGPTEHGDIWVLQMHLSKLHVEQLKDIVLDETKNNAFHQKRPFAQLQQMVLCPHRRP